MAGRPWTSSVDLASIGPQVREAAAQGVEQAAALVLAESQRLVPYIKGELAASGASGMVDELRAAFTYRDRGAVGAHERLDITPANGRQRKFLESAMNSQAQAAGETIAAAVRQVLGS